MHYFYVVLIYNGFIFYLRLATTAIKQLPPDVIASAQNSALWSKDEEHVLANVPAVCFFLLLLFL